MPRPPVPSAIAALAVCLSLFGFAASAEAACFADYKAKTDNPLKLHYGVIKLPQNACDSKSARAVIERRIGADGWQLLNVMSVFDESGLEQRKDSAGAYFLRY
ncbi:hypothetical protein [Oceaniovalibus sp. ACAM 378]|jgi:uncharacterized membrane protein|uniref:hypothetical protein n=1 Tax=Oceaniovalibus sp. ACAM 378 TaxID=2599923 RepID=UPI001651C372|nr:hypothetical protein [Oceaniovalibus sp. ACAM 378]